MSDVLSIELKVIIGSLHFVVNNIGYCYQLFGFT